MVNGRSLTEPAPHGFLESSIPNSALQVLINGVTGRSGVQPLCKLVHFQHGNRVDDECIRCDPKRNEKSPLAFSKDYKKEAYGKSPKGNGANELPDTERWHHSVRTTPVLKPRIVENQFQQHGASRKY